MRPPGQAVGTASGDYLIDVWASGARGLRNSSVTGIAQTPDGYLWVGTYNGLARFDGQRFVNFDPANTPALKRARVRRLILDASGTLWINTHDGSLTTYRNGQFQLEWEGDGSPDAAVSLVSTRSNQPTFLLYTGELIRARAGDVTNRWERLRPPGASTGELVAEDGAGVIWGRGRDQKLWRLVGNSFETVTATEDLVGKNFNVLTADAQGRLWVGTEREIAVWNGTRFDCMTPTNGEPGLNVMFLRVLPDGSIWSIANEKVRRARGREWCFEAESARGLFTGWRERTGMHRDEDGGVWFYDYSRGLLHIRADGRVRQLAAEENFPGERVDCFCEDREGNFWAGVDRGGLVRVREKRFSVLSPSDSPAVSVTEDAAGAVWVGTFGGGLHRWTDGGWTAFALQGGTPRGFVFSLVPGDADRLWASAGEEDLLVGTGGQFAAFSPAVHGVKALLRGRDGRLWIGKKSGLACITGGQLRQFLPEDGIERNDIRALAEDPQGVIWAGAGDGTLYRVETSGRNIRAQTFRNPDALGNLPIWSLLADPNGSVWVGTFRGGLMHFRDGQFTRYTTQHGLPDDVICQLLEDDAGALWVGSQQGIFRVRKRELLDFRGTPGATINLTAYGQYDGLPSLECSGGYQPAAWHTRDGRLMFATLRGVVAVKPGELSPNKLPPLVGIEDVLVDGQKDSSLQPPARPPRPGRRLTVAPGKTQIEFQYTGLSFVSPDRVRFRYKLAGLDRDWIEAGARRTAQYSFLRPGDYEFQVKACNNDGVWNDTGATLEVTVQPHFYETWTFKSLAVLAGIGLVVVAVRRIYVRRYRRKLEQLERQRAVERDRARIAKDIHDDLGAGLTHIALLSELARRDVPAELPNHVTQISDMARELTRNMDEIVWAIDPQNDTLDSLVTYVSKFAQDYLSVAGIRCRLDVPPELPPYVLPAEVRHNLFLAIKEALHNVVQHAQASEASLQVTVRPLAFSVILQDNGCGLGASRGERAGRISTGHGLANLEKRLLAIGGRSLLTSPPGGGTRVELSVDLTAPRSPELGTGRNPQPQRT